MDEDTLDTARKLSEKAVDDSVTASDLVNGEDNRILTHQSPNTLPIDLLLEGEQPHFFKRLHKMISRVSIEPKDGDEVAQINITGIFMITNFRIIVAGVEDESHDEDSIISIPIEQIESVELSGGGFLQGTPELNITTENFQYSMNPQLSKSELDDVVSFLRHSDPVVSIKDMEEEHYLANTETVYVCKECRKEVPSDAKKCPHCGYHPGGGGKGALWHGTALVTSFSPIGWAMMAKGAADEARSRSGVAEKTEQSDKEIKSKGSTENDPIEKIEKLDDLREKGVISDKEFQNKKKDLLDEI